MSEGPTKPRHHSPAPCTHLQLTVFRGRRPQMGIIGFVQQLREERPGELLCGEGVLVMETEEEGLGQASGLLPAICTSPLSQPHDWPPLTCRSFSAVGLFLGFLVNANLRKWWKFWVLVGTKVPQFLRQVSRRAWARPEVPPCKERGGPQGVPS